MSRLTNEKPPDTKIAFFSFRSHSLHAHLVHLRRHALHELELRLRALPLRLRYLLRSVFASRVFQHASTKVLDRPLDGLSAAVINLDTRPDRWESVSRHLETVGLDAYRFPAHQHAEGLAGCALSHSAVLSSVSKNWPVPLLILEDDVRFIGALSDVTSTLRDFLRDPALDVLCLAHRSGPPRVEVGKNLLIAQNILGTAAYVAKPRAAKLLSEIFLYSASQIATGKPPKEFALDVVWQKLQKTTLLFAVPSKAIATQSPGYSDIQKAHVDYTSFYEKSYVKKEQNPHTNLSG